MSTTSLNYTYVHFDIIDYTNSYVLSTFTLSNTPLTFVPNFQTSSILGGSQSISNKTLRWDFGDGSYSTELRPVHHYTWPGIYDVVLTVFDSKGIAYDSSYSATVYVKDFIATQINFQDYKSLIYDIPVGKLIDPLTINSYFSWQNHQALSATGYTINLYASGAHGAYNYTAESQRDKWSHLRTLSRFYTLSSFNGYQDYITIESIQPTITEIYVRLNTNNQLEFCQKEDTNSVLAGVTGSCQFWYTDDVPANLLTENNPIILFASIDNAKFHDALTQKTNLFNYIDYPPYGYQNINPAVFPNVKTRYNPATQLSITTTGIDGEGRPGSTSFDIPYISWQDTEIPYVIKFKDDLNFTTKNYPPLSSSITENTPSVPQPFYDVKTGIVYKNADGTYSSLDGVTFYEDFDTQAPQSIGAFYKGYFVSSQSTENCLLTAAVDVKDPPFYLKDALIGWISIPQYGAAVRILRQENYNGFYNTASFTFDNNSNSFKTGDNRNVYAITVAPSGSTANSDYRSWFADAINDRIICYDINGNEVINYTLSAMTTLINNQTSIIDYRYVSTLDGFAAATPNDLALDKNNNLWITLFDSGSAIKLDVAKNVVTAIASPSETNNQFYTLSSDYIGLSGFAGESLFLPASIDTDLDNNIWVAYTHPDFSRLIKYRGEDNYTIAADILKVITFPTGITPEQIQIDRNRNVWATAINHNSTGKTFNDRNDYLYKFDTNGNLIQGFPLTGFKQIGNMTIDGNQNAWVIQNKETLTKVDGITNQTYDYIAGYGRNITDYICSIGGITCDTANQIWVINNFDRNLYVFDANLQPTGAFFVKRTLPLSYPTTGIPVLSSYQTPITIQPDIYSDGIQEFQAYGDWNGYNWLNKYAAPVSIVRTITGSSSLFNIYPNTGQFNIAKINEDWNASGFYNSLRYQENLLDKQVFFDQFLGVILGGLDAQPYELGKTVYEKIANFVDNNSDITKSNLSELLSFCKELTIEFEQYNYVLPPQLRRLMDLLSIKQSILWGNPNKYALNFDSRGNTFASHTYGINLSTLINPLTGAFVNGIPFVAQEKFSGNFRLINTNYISEYDIGMSIPLSTYSPNWGWGLVAPDNIASTDIGIYYRFFEYNPVYNDTYYDNVINWGDSYTTLTPTNSSYENWSSDNGIIQSLLSYEMSKGLRLFTSAADITYNS